MKKKSTLRLNDFFKAFRAQYDSAYNDPAHRTETEIMFEDILGGVHFDGVPFRPDNRLSGEPIGKRK